MITGTIVAVPLQNDTLPQRGSRPSVVRDYRTTHPTPGDPR
jgi:hypothetical protein